MLLFEKKKIMYNDASFSQDAVEAREMEITNLFVNLHQSCFNYDLKAVTPRIHNNTIAKKSPINQTRPDKYAYQSLAGESMTKR